MANIFSGLFAGGDGSVANSAQLYKSQLEEWEELQEYKRRNEDLIGQSAAYDTAIENMSPERQDQMRLFQMQAGGRETGVKGQESIATGFSQRGSRMDDAAAQEERRKTHESNRLFDIANPDGSDSAAVAEAKFYMGPAWETATDEERQQGYRDSQRGRQYLDRMDSFYDPLNKESIMKRFTEAGTAEAEADYISDQLIGFTQHVDNTENFLNTFHRMREDVQDLYGQSTDWSTGWGGLMKDIPLTDAAAWNNLKDTIVSNIGLEKILELKDSSSQGATGLGALNAQELKMLQDHLGNLKNTSDPAVIKGILQDMDRDMARISERKMQRLGGAREFYNENKKFLGPSMRSRDPVLKSQEYLFDTDQFVRQPSSSTLGEDDADNSQYKDIKDKYNLVTE